MTELVGDDTDGMIVVDEGVMETVPKDTELVDDTRRVVDVEKVDEGARAVELGNRLVEDLVDVITALLDVTLMDETVIDVARVEVAKVEDLEVVLIAGALQIARYGASKHSQDPLILSERAMSATIG